MWPSLRRKGVSDRRAGPTDGRIRRTGGFDGRTGPTDGSDGREEPTILLGLTLRLLLCRHNRNVGRFCFVCPAGLLGFLVRRTRPFVVEVRYFSIVVDGEPNDQMSIDLSRLMPKQRFSKTDLVPIKIKFKFESVFVQLCRLAQSLHSGVRATCRSVRQSRQRACQHSSGLTDASRISRTNPVF